MDVGCGLLDTVLQNMVCFTGMVLMDMLIGSHMNFIMAPFLKACR